MRDVTTGEYRASSGPLRGIRVALASALAAALIAVACSLAPDPLFFWLEQAVLGTGIGRPQPEDIPSDADGFLYSLPQQGDGAESSSHPKWNGGDQVLAVLGREDLVSLLAVEIRGHNTAITTYVPASGGEAADQGDYLLELMDDVFADIRRTCPDIFWISLGEYNIHWIQGDADSYVPLTVKLEYCHTAERSAQMRRQIEDIAADILRETPEDPYEVALYFHNWIVENTSYASEVVDLTQMQGNEYAFNINGVFLDGSAVCEGYAKSFQYLCDLAELPCRTVFGVYNDQSHAWNYVLLEGKWYLVDCTTDDPVGGEKEILRWEAFHKGESGLVDGVEVAIAYQNDGGYYPTLAREDYSPPTSD